MITIPNYQILAQIYESANSLVYRGIRNEDEQSVILKVLKEDYPTPEELTRYRQEYDIIHHFNLDGVIKAYSLEKYQNTLVMCVEDFGGEPLKHWSAERTFSLEELLQLAIWAADILGKIHQQHIIHKDINPANLIFNPTTKQLKIIDFGISTRLSRETQTLKNPNVLEGTLAYMSPEQTGRMNRALDYRTDFYSLGVTFYELFTRSVPFETTNAMELVHCHIAKQPQRPIDVNLALPSAISDIIMKLLEKTAEMRYQSAWGIKADLENCLNQWQTSGQIESFLLARSDISERLQIPQKLYGREREIDTLLAAFEQVSQGHTQMMLIAGYSGVGKSVLVKEIYKSLTVKQGYFISGKFDQFQRNIPYSAIAKAFGELTQQLLTESESILAQWQEKLLTALGPNGQVIIDVIPEVERIIGKQSAVPQLGPTESQNRFHLVFQNFMRVFCQPKHPLVIFLDDLQWADSATLKLLELVMTDKETGYLFLIGAYRDNEVSPTHALMMTLDRLHKEEATINQINLTPLNLEHVNQLIADSLHTHFKAAQSLTELVMRKTAGNPFFVNQFLKTLYEENLLTFDVEQLSWQWEVVQIEAMNITDNVVDLMIGKLKKLSHASQHVLRLAACVGNRFDLNTLSVIYEKSPPDTFQNLMPVLTEGLVLPTSELEITEADVLNSQFSILNYQFLHDRVQQAAYALIDDSQKKSVHLQIGRLLLKNTPTDELEDHIFEIAEQLNHGLELLDNQADKNEMARLNLIAGQKAKVATAYIAAIKYLNVGRELLAKDSWETKYDLTLALYVEATEAAYLGTDFEKVERLAEVVLQQANTVLDQVKVYEVQIRACIAQGQLREAVRITLTVLKLLGISLPEKPTASDIQLGFEETMSNIGDKPIEDLIDLPEMTEPHKLAAVRLLSIAFSPVIQTIPELGPLMACQQVNLLIKHGNAKVSALAYSTYGLFLCSIMEDIETGFRFGKLALRVLERFNAKEFQTKTSLLVHFFIRHLKEHLKETLTSCVEAYQSGLETGELEYAAYCAADYSLQLYFSGKELAVVEREITTYSEAISQLKQEPPFHWNEIFRQTVLNLRDGHENPCLLKGVAYNEDTMLPLRQKANDSYAILCIHVNKLILCYLFQEYPQAVENAALVTEAYLGSAAGSSLAIIFHFYDSLAQLAVYPDSPPPEQDHILDKVTTHQVKMEKWAKHAPMNFQHKYDLVEAERARVLGQVLEAEACYEKSISGAMDNGYIQEEALAYELAAEFYLARGMEKFAQTYMKEAHYAYQQWGAMAKVKDLEQRYPQFLAQKTSRVPARPTVMTTSHGTVMASIYPTQQTPATFLDLNSVVKASQTLSGEIVLSRLLDKMMQIVIENAGAEKGFLLLPKGDNWFIEAESFVDNPSVTVLQSLPVEGHPQVAKAITYYVARTKESVVLNNATREGNFTRDPYIIKYQPKSVLCAPLLNQAKLTGILYLENNLTTGAFTPDRLEMLGLLSSQAAISIENSMLYNGLEQKVAERTRDLEQEIVERKRAEDAAKVANQAKSQFLANMSHELRTPLNAILGFAQIMQRSRSLPSEHIDNVRIVNRSGEYLLSLINDVLDMSKIEAGKITLDEQNFDLYRLLDEVHDMFYLRAENKHLQLQAERGDGVPRYIRTDGTKLRQVLINLLSNALKFTQQGGIYLSLDETGRESEETTLAFRIEDTGAGVAPEELDKLFEAFTQTASGRSAQEGTGLGLPISRKFVQLMGGDITVQSEVGKGTVFQFTIHASVVSAAEIANEQGPQRQVIALEPNQPRFRLLIVDDKWDNRQLLIKLLNPLGFELREAGNGIDAVDICESFKPHLIWMDVRMPVMDGLQATQHIKATLSGKEVAIVALTASTLEEEQTVALSAGCDDFLRKPFRDADIFDMMHKLIGVRYVYEEMTDTVPQEQAQEVLTSEALTALPGDLLTQLQQAVISLDTELMQILIAQVRQQDESVANGFALLANDFEYERLLELIEHAQT